MDFVTNNKRKFDSLASNDGEDLMVAEDLEESLVAVNRESFNFDNIDGKEPMQTLPSGASDVLEEFNISLSDTTRGITTIPSYDMIKQANSLKREGQRFAWCAPIDDRGKTPEEIKQLLYLLQNIQKTYMLTGKGNKNGLFNVREAEPNGAYVQERFGYMYHYMLSGDDGNIERIPNFQVNIFIDRASTGGNNGFSKNYMFVVLEVPITLDFVELVDISCSKSTMDMEGNKVRSQMQQYWVNIANHMKNMGCSPIDNVGSMMKIQYDDLFDEHSDFCMWKIFRVAPAIFSARRHMHTCAIQHRVKHLGENVKNANERVHIIFDNIDSQYKAHVDPYAYDKLWQALSFKTSSEFYSNYEEHKRLVRALEKERKKADRQNNAQQAADDDEHGDLNAPKWSPAICLDGPPNFIDMDRENVSNFINLLLTDPNISVSDVLDFLLENSDVVKMKGFPRSTFYASVELTMFDPSSSQLVPYEPTWAERNTCMLPSNIGLQMLLRKHERASSAPGGAFNGIKTAMPDGIVTVGDLRRLIKMNGGCTDLGEPLKGRAKNVYRARWMAVQLLHKNIRAFDMYERYVKETVLAILPANLVSETAEMGGADARLNIICQIASSLPFCAESRHKCAIAHTFNVGKEHIVKNWCKAGDLLPSYAGTYFGAEMLWFSAHQIANINLCLKPDNMRTLTELYISDVFYYLSFLGGNMEFAPNGIGGIIWVQNFNGNAEEYTKVYGTGADHTMISHAKGQDPANTETPPHFDISKYERPEEIKTASQQSFNMTYSVDILRSGEVLNQVTSIRSNRYFTEMTTEKDGKNPLWNLIKEQTPRNTTGTDAVAQRDTSVQLPSGKWTSVKRKTVDFMRTMMIATNSTQLEADAKTVECVSHIVPAGGVSEDTSMFNGKIRGQAARKDAGKRAKYTGEGNVLWAKQVQHILSRDVTTLTCVVAYIQSCGFFGSQGEIKIKKGVESTWQEIIISNVRMHGCYMCKRASDSKNMDRIEHMARARITAYALHLHAINTLNSPEVVRKGWNDVVHSTLVNFLADPVPTQCIPVFMASLLFQTFDWMLILIMGIFCDMFQVPAMDPDIMEQMFADPTFDVPEEHAKPVREWLHKIGFSNANSGGGARNFAVFSPPRGESPMARSALYITNNFEDGDDVQAISVLCDSVCILSCEDLTFAYLHLVLSDSHISSIVQDDSMIFNLNATKNGHAADDSKNVNTKTRIAQMVAKRLMFKNQEQLSKACNIVNDKALINTIAKYTGGSSGGGRLVHYPRFGAIPCGAGYQSMNNILRAVRTSMQDAANATSDHQQTFVDGSANSVSQMIESSDAGYATSMFYTVPVNGDVYKFGANVLMLLRYAAIFGKRRKIAQPSIQAHFHHETAQFIAHRIPRSFYAPSHIYTSMPCSETQQFSFTELPKYVSRPTTAVREPPDNLVLDPKCHKAQGLLDGMRMPEDQMSAPLDRLAETVSTPDCVVSRRDIKIPELTLPQLPLHTSVYFELVIGKINTDPEQQPAVKTVVGVAFVTDEKTNWGMLKYAKVDPQELTVSRLDLDGQLSLSNMTRTALEQHEWQTIQLKEGPMHSVLRHTSNYFVQTHPQFNRRSVLVQIPHHHSGSIYAILIPWNSMTNSRCSGYFNPRTLGYLAYVDKVSTETAFWPQTLPDAQSDSDEMEIDRPVTTMHEMSWNLPAPLALDFLIPIGTRVLIDANNPDIIAMFQDSTIGCLVPGRARGVAWQAYLENERGGDALHIAPVMEATLVFEQPDAIMHSHVDNPDQMVYVGMKAFDGKNPKKTDCHVVYAAVPPRSLVTQNRVSLLQIEIVSFGLFL